MMPKDAYSIETTSIILKSGEKEVKTSVSVDGKSLKNWHSYAIPVTIKSVSQYYFEESKKTIFVIYRPDNLQGWYTVEGLEKNSKDWSVSSYPKQDMALVVIVTQRRLPMHLMTGNI